MQVKKIIAGLLLAGLNTAALADWPDLVLTNLTKHEDSTAQIHNVAVNQDVCSTMLGKSGTTHSGQTNRIPNSDIRLVCGDLPPAKGMDCNATVFTIPAGSAPNCDASNPTTKKIARVVLNTKTGVKSVTMLDQAYIANFDSSHITISGGPTN